MEHRFKKIATRFFAAFVFMIAGFLLAINQADAATIYLSPSAKTIKVGDTFTVKAFINTQGRVINAAEGSISFSDDLVNAMAVSSAGSIFSLWPETPSFSNSAGRALFNGGVPNPGYNGSGGQVVNVTFKAKSPGVAFFSLSGVSIRENDGLGTDIFSGQSGTSVTITGTAETSKPAPETIEPTKPKLSLPSIYSSSYPDQGAWYSAVKGVVGFRFPNGSGAIQTLLDGNPYSAPTISYRPPVYSKEISNLSDGVWYFHLRYQLNGEWSNSVHYKIQIDTSAPKGLIIETKSVPGGVNLTLKAEDSLSGMDRYEIVVDDSKIVRKVTSQEASQPVLLANLASGEHSVKVMAFDKAGNKSEMSRLFQVESLSAPTINEISSPLDLGQKILISGSSTPSALIKLSLVDSAGQLSSYDAVADNQGNFSLNIGPIGSIGDYSLTATALDKDGLSSQQSEARKFSVVEIRQKAVIAWPELAIVWSSFLPLVGWLVLVLFMLYGWYKFWITRKKLIAAKKRSEQAFMMLLDRADQQIMSLEKAGKKRKLSRAESLALLELSEIMGKIRQMRKEEND